MKRLLALMLAICLFSGCQLASEEQREDQLQDKLVGVFVTFDQMDLDFDIEGWLEDNPGALKDGDVTLEFGEGQEYVGQRPVRAGEDGWVVPGYEGISIGRLWNGEYWTGFSTEGVCGLNSHIASGEEGDAVNVEGTVYFPAGSEVMLCTNPVYMTAEGEYYVLPGNSFYSSLEGGSMSQSVSDEKTWTVDGVETRYSAEFTTVVEGVTLAEAVRFVWMSDDHAELDRAEYIPGQLPETITPPGDAAYLIAEEITGEGVSRTLYQPGDDSVKVFYQSEQPWCLPDFTEVQWPE